MLYLYTENFRLWPRTKNLIKKMLGKQSRGPQAVIDSLLRGLDGLKVDYRLNQKNIDLESVACVLSGVKTLAWAVKQKQQGNIKRIAAGPNIVVTPLEENGIIMSPEVDVFVVPASWSKDWWGSLAPGFAKRIKLWPAGVKDKGILRNDKNGQALIFQKNAPSDLLEAVAGHLEALKVPYKILRYGKFSHQEYFEILRQSRFLIYLSASESQGIALNEAWMGDIPSLVWNRGYMEYKNFRWEDKKISAPFMDISCGEFFKGKEDFGSVAGDFIRNLDKYHPRAYSLQNFTDQVSAKKYLEIISQL